MIAWFLLAVLGAWSLGDIARELRLIRRTLDRIDHRMARSEVDQ